ncbi:hypothetical protein [Gordonia aquimaris]|uniref:Uncharacterized protein n=1 Tax=Gordonia aquimaris TaxID=2984863 RepID=A0A9X3D670_9ACTN|nr:hypothetical protein [Gordonia aquimaris]MCX2964372.1 hypothetical protein [Gordonia aquimaris]
MTERDGGVRGGRRTPGDVEGHDDEHPADPAAVDLFGLGSAAVIWSLGIFALTYVVVAVGAGWEIRSWVSWVGAAAGLAAFGVAAAFVVGGRGARTPAPVAVAVTGLVVGALALSLWSLPVETYRTLQTSPPVSALTVVATMLALHRRPVFAWVGAVCASVVAGVWGVAQGFGYPAGAEITFFCFPVLVMATLFVLMAPPMEVRIRALREREIAQAQTEAAARAGAAERHDQLRRLDRGARPILQRMVDRHAFGPDEVIDARLTEAQLRDGIRARAWESEEVRSAAWQARRRGVTVLLLDDGALDARGDTETARRLRRLLVAELRAARDGQITARVLPPGREVIASVVVNSSTGVSRTECRFDGAVCVFPGTLS